MLMIVKAGDAVWKRTEARITSFDSSRYHMHFREVVFDEGDENIACSYDLRRSGTHGEIYCRWLASRHLTIHRHPHGTARRG